MDELLKFLYFLPITTFGILVLVALAVIMEMEGILAALGRPRREMHEREFLRHHRSYNPGSARRSSEDTQGKTRKASRPADQLPLVASQSSIPSLRDDVHEGQPSPAGSEPVTLSVESVSKSIDVVKIAPRGNNLVVDTASLYVPKG